MLIVDCHLQAHLLVHQSWFIDPRNIWSLVYRLEFSPKNMSKHSFAKTMPHNTSRNKLIDPLNGILLLS